MGYLPSGSVSGSRGHHDGLFDDVDREFDETMPAGVPFLHITRDGDSMVLRADPADEP